MTQYRKKPVVIDAIRNDCDPEMHDTLMRMGCRFEVEGAAILISTLEGVMRADRGDWIIRGVAGEFYPCKPEIFAATYEAVDTEAFAPALTPQEFSKQHLEPLMLKAHDHGFLMAGLVVEPEAHPDGDGLLAGSVASAIQSGEQGSGRTLLIDLLRQQADLLEGQS